MVTTTFRERFARRRAGVDEAQVVTALEYVRDDGRR
jgi:hypothetical protein